MAAMPEPVKPEREHLRAWYRQAMTRRADELRALRERLVAGDAEATVEARAVGQALRGSGSTFGFAELSAEAALVESATGAQLMRRVEGLIERLAGLSAPTEGGPALHAEWLLWAAGLGEVAPLPFADLASAWKHASERGGLSAGQLAERVARLLGTGTADLGRAGRAALRLVPEALIRRALVLSVGEDAETITVASADPTSLSTELELTRLTGREPVFMVAPPEAIESAIGALLDVRLPEPAPRRRAVVSEGEAGKVLVVDDDSSSRLLARAVLEKRGYSVDEAGDGAQALDRLRVGPPVALVVADLNMPEMDGLELLWQMRADADLSHIPVIVLTGETDAILETKLIEEGADDYVCKPLDPRLFLARVAATIRRSDA
ncbi:MAG TPA: response regulator [Longimicrobiales bacterium]|nr:response regulator [Longimicrobiales bacterium]